MDDENPETISVTSNDIVSAFGGWHYSSASVTNTTLGAIAVNGTRTDLTNKLENAQCFQILSPIAFDDISTNRDGNKFAGSKAFLDALQTDIKASSRPLVQVPTVTVTGSSYSAVPTLCYVRSWLKATPLFSVVRLKAMTHLNLTYGDWITECGTDGYYLKDTQAKRNPECLALKLLKNSTLKINSSLLATLQTVTGFDVALANLYIATLVHHMVCNDGGTQFRDKPGVAAAANQVALGAQGVLFLAQVP